jgi:Outer membrane protein beta-barrel domain
MKKILLSICALMVLGITAMHAQTKTSLTYGIGFGMGDLGDFISKPSFRGATLDFRQMTSDKLGIGFSLGWNVFYEEKSYDTYTFENQSLSGKQYRYSNNIPMLASFDYYLTAGQRINPFVGLGTGVMYTRRNTDMNLYTVEQEAWNFTLQPQIGIEIDNNISSSFTIIAKYYNGFAAGDLENPQSYFSINVGWTFKS